MSQGPAPALVPRTAEQIPLDRIDPDPQQPRRTFQGLDDLAASLAARGQLQPVLVRRVGDRYRIIAGERRFRAARRLHWERLWAVVETGDRPEAAVYEDALVENLHREDLSAIELAEAFRQLAILRGLLKGVDPELARLEPEEVGPAAIDVDRLAEALARPRRQVERHLRLLTAPRVLRHALRDHAVPYSAAEGLAALGRRGKEGLLEALTLVRENRWQESALKQARTGKTGTPPPAPQLLGPVRDGVVRVRTLRIAPDLPAETLARLRDEARTLLDTLERYLGAREGGHA